MQNPFDKNDNMKEYKEFCEKAIYNNSQTENETYRIRNFDNIDFQEENFEALQQQGIEPQGNMIDFFPLP